MSHRLKFLIIGVLVPVLAAACAVDLGTLRATDTVAEATGVNGSGAIVGLSGNISGNSPYEGFRRLRGASMEPLGPLPGDDESDAYGVNDEGIAVGRSCHSLGGDCRAVMWGLDGSAFDIGVIGNTAEAQAVNKAGVVVGTTQHDPTSRTDPLVSRAFYWSPGASTMTELPLAPGATQAWGVAINGSGQVAGTMTYPDGDHAVRWQIGSNVVDDLGPGHAFAMNDLGVVAGQAGNVGAIWYPGRAAPTLIGTLGGTESEVYGLNDAGVAVGGSTVSGGDPGHAVAWSASGGLVDLGTLDGQDSVALAVNDGGLAVGTATVSGGWHAAAFTIPPGPAAGPAWHRPAARPA
jgi:uncharacterized membrane protein